MNPCLTPKKALRAQRRVSRLFASLENGEHFYITPKQRAVKISFCAARPFAKEALSATDWGAKTPWQFVNPFRSVFIDRPGGKSSCYAVPMPPFPPNMGQTHFVGDDCPGGHKDDLPRAEQPSSDNSVTGPTA